MNAARILTTLAAHGLDVRLSKGVVYAYEVATVRDANGVVVDASDWVAVPTSKAALMAWLGY